MVEYQRLFGDTDDRNDSSGTDDVSFASGRDYRQGESTMKYIVMASK
jgi:hypothetical protein